MNKDDVKKQWHELVAAKTHDPKLVAGSESGRWQRFDEAVGVDLLIKIQAYEYRLAEMESEIAGWLKAAAHQNDGFVPRVLEFGDKRFQALISAEGWAEVDKEKAALVATLATTTAANAALEEKLANRKAHSDHLQAQFQRETLRTGEQYQMLVKWMKRNADKGCSAEPWAKDDCPDCTLMRETKELLERPINVTREEARKKGAEHGE